MGLALVHGIVHSHGGVIRLADADRTGAVFEVYLPQVDSASTTQSDSQPPPVQGSERILLVDDEPALVDMWQALLVKLGYTVRSFTDSRAALDHFRSHPQDFDLVVTDQTMPHITGLALTREIHQVRPEMPVICAPVSAAPSPTTPWTSTDSRVWSSKPILVTELARQIRKALD